MKPIHIIGVPLDLGGGRRGVDMGPSAFRIAGLSDQINAMGRAVFDKGNLPSPIPETKRPADKRKKYIRDIGKVTYLNCCDWVESCTALAEDSRGRIRLLHWAPPERLASTNPAALPLARVG